MRVVGFRSVMGVRAGPAWPGLRLTASTVALAVGSALCLGYVLWRPFTPDLAAQLARANLVRRSGDVWWWTGWFGGLSLPTYSLLSPPIMATLGVSISGALLTVAACWGAGILARDALRPRAGAAVFSLFAVADLLIGRVTFAVGLGFAVWALVAVRARAPAMGMALTLLCYLSSPLAGLFLGLVLVAVMIVDPTRRRHAGLSAGLLLACGAATALLFPGAGRMHFGLVSVIAPGVGCLLVAILCRPRVVRAAALLTLGAFGVFMVVPAAVGSNVERLAWVCAVPVLVACAPLDRRRLALVGVALAAWPVATLIVQVRWVPDATTQSGYYRPLLHRLGVARAAAGPSGIGERVEVLDTATHSGSLYLAPAFAIARGWDRQADEANNPIFYRDGALTPARYHAWLHDLAVGWVAIPSAGLDYASRAEAGLINSGLPYLALIWSSPHWRLYRVRDPAPLATGAAVTAVGPASVGLRTRGPADVLLRVRWSPYLRVVGASGDPTDACISRAELWTRVHLPAAGQYSIVSSFDPTARFGTPDDSCTSAPRPGPN